MCHPQQIIKRSSDPKNIIILQTGEVGFIVKETMSKKLRDITL
jgi:hypothetical protein